MLFCLFTSLLQCALGVTAVMASNQSSMGIPNIEAFVASLDLSSDNEAQIVKILKDTPEVASVSADESKQRRTLPSLVDASYRIAKVAFSRTTFLEKPRITSLVAESW